jgi:hypothetical protein
VNESVHDDDQVVTDRTYRTIARAVAYARPERAPLVQLEIGQVLTGRAADVADWVAWVDEGDVIGYLRLDELELVEES